MGGKLLWLLWLRKYQCWQENREIILYWRLKDLHVWPYWLLWEMLLRDWQMVLVHDLTFVSYWSNLSTLTSHSLRTRYQTLSLAHWIVYITCLTHVWSMTLRRSCGSISILIEIVSILDGGMMVSNILRRWKRRRRVND